MTRLSVADCQKDNKGLTDRTRFSFVHPFHSEFDLVLGVHYQISKEALMSSLAIYLIGLVIFVAGLVYGAHLLHVPEKWIGVGFVVMVGLGVLIGAIKTRQRDSSGS